MPLKTPALVTAYCLTNSLLWTCASCSHSVLSGSARISLSSSAMFDRDAASPFVLRFYVAFNEGDSCPRLHELGNEAKRYGANNDQQNQMNLKPHSVGCSGDTAKRMLEVPPNTGNLQVLMTEFHETYSPRHLKKHYRRTVRYQPPESDHY